MSKTRTLFSLESRTPALNASPRQTIKADNTKKTRLYPEPPDPNPPLFTFCLLSSPRIIICS